MSPCVSTPRRSARTRHAATIATSRSGTPCAPSNARAKASAAPCATHTRMPSLIASFHLDAARLHDPRPELVVVPDQRGEFVRPAPHGDTALAEEALLH